MRKSSYPTSFSAFITSGQFTSPSSRSTNPSIVPTAFRKSFTCTFLIRLPRIRIHCSGNASARMFPTSKNQPTYSLPILSTKSRASTGLMNILFQTFSIPMATLFFSATGASSLIAFSTRWSATSYCTISASGRKNVSTDPGTTRIPVAPSWLAISRHRVTIRFPSVTLAGSLDVS